MKRGNEAVDGDQREEYNARRRDDRTNETAEEAKRRKMERNRMDNDCRGNEDEQQKEERNERRRIQRVAQRFQYTHEVNNTQSKVDNEEHNCGNMPQTCNYCSTLY